MGGEVFFLRDNGTLVSMQETGHEREDLFQELLASYPALLAGSQVNQQNPRRWLLIDREMDVPGEEGGNRRWSIDHLFLDQDGIPTLVEVKRSTDTRIRREVVGQMLDYAANAVAYWPVEKLQARLERLCDEEGTTPSDKIAACLGEELDESTFWSNVKTNLQAGRIRMVFVADIIPPELQRVVEFLNGQMDPAEVLALEIRQYVGEGHKTLVPRVLGRTVAAAARKAVLKGELRQWDELSFLEDLTTRCGEGQAQAARTLLDWAKQRNLSLWWGKGQTDGSFYPEVRAANESRRTFSVWTYGRVEVQFQHMKSPFETAERRLDLLNRLNQVPGIVLEESSVSRRPTFPLSALLDPEALKKFLAAYDWCISEVRQALVGQ